MSLNSDSDALRIIGRDLDLRAIRTFILRRDADLLIVTGGYQSPPAIMPVTVHYTHGDIGRVREEVSSESDCLTSIKDFSHLEEILSAVGDYVSRKQGRLVSISNTVSTATSPVITVKYISAQSEPVVEMFRGSAIYELCISVYKTKCISKEPNRYTRFSELSDMDQRY